MWQAKLIQGCHIDTHSLVIIRTSNTYSCAVYSKLMILSLLQIVDIALVIFSAPEGSPYQSLFLRYEIEKGLRAVYSPVKIINI